eukprot:scaffold315060_cov22-Tisochrysis_lutea.AAC.1
MDLKRNKECSMASFLHAPGIVAGSIQVRTHLFMCACSTTALPLLLSLPKCFRTLDITRMMQHPSATQKSSIQSRFPSPLFLQALKYKEKMQTSFRNATLAGSKVCDGEYAGCEAIFAASQPYAHSAWIGL